MNYIPDKLSGAIKLYFNQNLIVLIVGFIGLGFSEFYHLECGYLYDLSKILSTVALISVSICLLAYTINYWVE